ncbi:hypothetical protein BFINE_57460 [Bacteroides finegoldii DSM 17565]|nr:hypothetical protein BFINE_57460 [Bacteroides finegoldii DSM 17565]
MNHESLFADFESIPKDMKVNRSENRSASENKSNRYNWMIGIMRRLNEKGTTLGLNVTNSDSWEIMRAFRCLRLLISSWKTRMGMIRYFIETNI